eukprot:scaffold99047_cov55-Attheya_sp.AAC.3
MDGVELVIDHDLRKFCHGGSRLVLRIPQHASVTLIGDSFFSVFLEILAVFLRRQSPIHQTSAKATNGLAQSLQRFIVNIVVGPCPNAAHPGNRSTVINDLSPSRTGFVPPGITDIGTKGEQEAQGGDRQGKRHHGQLNSWQKVDECVMFDAPKISPSLDQKIIVSDNECTEGGNAIQFKSNRPKQR